MSPEMEHILTTLAETNAHHGPKTVGAITKTLTHVYSEMLKKGYSDEQAIESARDFYLLMCQGGGTVWDGQHR